MRRGWFTFYYGPMFSGKTAALAEDANSLSKVAKRRVMVFMPALDTRRSTTEIVSLSGARAPATQVKDPLEILSRAIEKEAEEVLIDEIHFFQQRTKQDDIEEWSIIFVVKKLLQRGINVHAAGLNTDFLGYPFRPTTDSMGLADDLVRKRALCVICGDPADWTLRMINDQPVGPGGELIVVAGTKGEESATGETYEARCSLHHPFV